MTFPARLTELLEKATKGPIRVSKSGYSLKAGELDEKKIIATCPNAVLMNDAKKADIEQWLDNAELWAYLVNHAEALRDLVVAAEEFNYAMKELPWASGATIDLANKLCQALAKLEEQ